MARNKRNATATAADMAGVGVDAFDASVDTTLRKLREQLAAAQADLEKATAQLAEATPPYEAAKAAVEKAENRQAIGIAQPGEVEKAQAQFEQARQAYARAEEAMEDAERRVKTLPDAITEREQAVKTVVRDNLRQAYHEKLARLAELIREAKAVSDEVDALHYQAQRQFMVTDLLNLGGGLISALDLGEAGGFTTQGAGMTNQASPWLTNTRGGRNQKSMADLWLKEVDAYLAISPEARAERDRQHRTNALANAQRRKAEAAANAKAREELRNLIAARHGLDPSEVLI